jgi:hypothetical protein
MVRVGQPDARGIAETINLINTSLQRGVNLQLYSTVSTVFE